MAVKLSLTSVRNCTGEVGAAMFLAAHSAEQLSVGMCNNVTVTKRDLQK